MLWSRVLEKPPGPHLVEKFPNTLWNQKVHYCTHKSLTAVTAVNQMNPSCIPLRSIVILCSYQSLVSVAVNFDFNFLNHKDALYHIQCRFHYPNLLLKMSVHQPYISLLHDSSHKVFHWVACIVFPNVLRILSIFLSFVT
jgi:hypothetical protein